MIPTTHSLPDHRALAESIQSAYDIGEITWCRLWERGLNDTYQLVGADGRIHALRISRAAWRTIENVRYELDALHHLAAGPVRVVTPIQRRDGDSLTVIDAPEGPRPAIVSEWLPAVTEVTDWTNYSMFLGADVARIHIATDTLASPHKRFALDTTHLLLEPLATLPRYMTEADLGYIRDLARRLSERINDLAPTLDWGFCHGDIHGGNAPTDADGNLTHFDFDCCGPGWRAYDIATHRWSFRSTPDSEDAFLAGYLSVRPLPDVDTDAVDVFVAARVIWWLGLMAGANADVHGSSRLTELVSDRVGALRKWEAERLS